MAQKFEKAVIETDGTREGTTVKINGKTVNNLAVFHMTFWNDDIPPSVDLEYTTVDPNAEGGTLRKISHFRLVPPPPKSEASEKDNHQPGHGLLEPIGNSPAHMLPRDIDRRAMFAQI